ncbi:hypothetical protein PPERSA_06967 [Pseudocohnilembus persalinus]|uniref:Uncharacterized protein n=1 Tax=Pseudocohnilembus persalinus TaxID=266149 RepID=A0A0V0QZM6_PSEPJ|nr:hypothetical protein PPERSA_06967 [Pseudocohnilembus persalinus]|eukprot:KRX07352.1 hypothetical protein PPERSA_06967 [Pseudocohnilembus persalinus]
MLYESQQMQNSLLKIDKEQPVLDQIVQYTKQFQLQFSSYKNDLQTYVNQQNQLINSNQQKQQIKQNENLEEDEEDQKQQENKDEKEEKKKLQDSQAKNSEKVTFKNENEINSNSKTDNFLSALSPEQLLETVNQLQQSTLAYKDVILNNEKEIEKSMLRRFSYTRHNPPTYSELKKFSKFLCSNVEEFAQAFNELIQANKKADNDENEDEKLDKINENKEENNQKLDTMFIKTGILNFNLLLNKLQEHCQVLWEIEDNKQEIETLINEPRSFHMENSQISQISNQSSSLDYDDKNEHLKIQKQMNKENQKIKSLEKKLGKYCEELCCEFCLSQGPHNNRLHRIENLGVFQKQQTENLQKLITEKLGSKREKLYNQVEKMQEILGQIEKESSVIQKDADLQFDGIISRLQISGGNKLSVLQNDISQLQRQINDIEDITTVFDRLIVSNDQINFLFFFKKINKEVERLQSIHFNPEIKHYPYDLPRELSQIKIQLQQLQSNEQILAFKSQIIYQLKQRSKESIEKIKETTNSKFQKEFDYWIDLTERLTHSFSGYNMICHFCCELMSHKSINAPCQRNKSYRPDPNFIGYTEKMPSKDFYGCKRHFFARPIDLYRFPQLGHIERLESGDILIGYNIQEIKKAHNRKINKALGRVQKGYVNVIQFEYILNNTLGLDEKETYSLTRFVLEREPEQKSLNSLERPFMPVGRPSGLGSSPYSSYNNIYENYDQKNQNVKKLNKKNQFIDFKMFISLIDDQKSLEQIAQQQINVERIRSQQNEFFVHIPESDQYLDEENDNLNENQTKQPYSPYQSYKNRSQSPVQNQKNSYFMKNENLKNKGSSYSQGNIYSNQKQDYNQNNSQNNGGYSYIYPSQFHNHDLNATLKANQISQQKDMSYYNNQNQNQNVKGYQQNNNFEKTQQFKKQVHFKQENQTYQPLNASTNNYLKGFNYTGEYKY